MLTILKKCNNLIGKKNFSLKYIPINHLKFEDIGYEQKICNIYTAKNKVNKNAQIYFKAISASLVGLTLLKYKIFGLMVNVIFQPIIAKSYFNYRRNMSMYIKNLMLLNS